MTESQANADSPVDYRGSQLRELLAWVLYPLLVLMPFAWLVLNFDRENTGLLIGFAYFSLLSTCIQEWVQPCVRHWRRSQGDLLTDIAHQLLTGIFTGLHGPWQHANVYYKLGWLNWIFAGAELHRWHHSTLAGECNNNYGNNLIVWDAVFGTRFLPASRSIPAEIGLDGQLAKFPRSWWGQQLAPFRWRHISHSVNSVGQSVDAPLEGVLREPGI